MRQSKEKILLWSAALILLAIGVDQFVRHRYVLDGEKLEASIRAELPHGTPKLTVVQFMQVKKPLVYDDLGAHVKARPTGRAENLIFRKDIVLDFEFDTNGKLLSFSKQEYLTGL
jgi:hypothetical protein